MNKAKFICVKVEKHPHACAVANFAYFEGNPTRADLEKVARDHGFDTQFNASGLSFPKDWEPELCQDFQMQKSGLTRWFLCCYV